MVLFVGEIVIIHSKRLLRERLEAYIVLLYMF